MERVPKGIYMKELREEAVRLVEVEKLGLRETARRLSIPSGTLKNWVMDAAQSKNRKPIAVPLNREALAVLFRQLGKKHPDRVFTRSGKPIANVNTRAWRKALLRAGIENFR